MNSITKLVKIPQIVARRGFHASATLADASKQSQLQDFNPSRYTIPLRYPTMDDCMEPYGSWKVAYEAEKKRANRMLMMGVISLGVTLAIFYNSGVMDGLFMPNLDNIMEETGRVDAKYEREGRISVIQPDSGDEE